MNLVCINCPKGCHLIVEDVNGQIIVTGNTCERGKQYAIDELTHPLRTLTTTVGIISSQYERLPVITSNKIPKEKMFEVMAALKDTKTKAPIKMGDVIVKNILDLGVDIIASKSISK